MANDKSNMHLPCAMNPDEKIEKLPMDITEIENKAAGILADWGEVALDSFLDEGPLKAIPVLGDALKLFDGVKTLRDIFFIQKLVKFVRYMEKVDPKKRQQFRDRLTSDREFAKRTASHLTVVLDRLDEVEKAALLARIFGAYVSGALDQAQMRRLTAVLERVLFVDLLALRDFVRDQKALSRENYDGLEGVGLAFADHSIIRPVKPDDIRGQMDGMPFLLSSTAVLLVKMAF